MFLKFFPNSFGSHSFSLAAALAVAALAGLAGTATAGVIYQDNFSGSSANPLNGTSPAVDATGATWTADTGWRANGSQTDADYNAATGAQGSSDAYLPFTPSSGNVYTLSADLNVVGSPNPNWFAIGFVQSFSSSTSSVTGAANNGNGVNAWPGGSGTDTSSASYLNAGPWLLVQENNVQAPYPNQYFTGPGTSGSGTYPASVGTADMSIVLNTEASAWTYQIFEGGVSVTPVVTFKANPTIGGVMLGQWANTSGTVSNFSLTSVPEPASLGVLAIGGAIGLLMLKRRAA